MDAALINSATDLSSLAAGLRRQGRYFVGPCPFCGGEDRFNIKRTAGGDLWICRRCGDGKYHDAVSFLMRRDGLSFTEVVAGKSPAGPVPTELQPEEADELARPPDETWQLEALAALKKCCDYLHASDAPDAAAVWRYLRRRRGLTPETALRASLGYNPAWLEVAPGRWLAPGVTIPGMVGGELWYVRVRTTVKARAEAGKRGKTLGKYTALTGSRLKALYNADAILRALQAAPADDRGAPQHAPGAEPLSKRGSRSVSVVVVEGEFDALLLSQFLPSDWAAVTMGSAGMLPGLNWLPYLAVARRVLVGVDHDEAGAATLARWRRLAAGVEPLAHLPGGAKDITDFRLAGGDVGAWVGEILDTRTGRGVTSEH